MVSEIWSTTDRIFCYSERFFALLWTQKIKIWKNEKNVYYKKDIIILQMCTINDCHMMYGSWDMEYNGQKFLSFLTDFCPFTQNIKIWKNEKKRLDISLFHTCVQKIMIIWYTVPEIWCATDRRKDTEKVTYRGGCPN